MNSRDAICERDLYPGAEYEPEPEIEEIRDEPTDGDEDVA